MDIAWTEVADRVWTTAVQPQAVNVVLVAGDDHAMLVDTGGTPETGAAVLAAARAHVDVPVDTVVITHADREHWFGLGGMADVTSFAHENILAVEAPSGLQPTTTFSMIHGLDLGNRFVELVHFGPAHSRSDILVVVHGADVIMLGDLFQDQPWLDDTSSPSKWPMVLDNAVGSSRSATVFIPGHGNPVQRPDVLLCGGKLGYLYSTVEELVQRGVPLDGLYEEVEEWPFSEVTVRAALPHLVADLAARGVVARTQLPIRGI